VAEKIEIVCGFRDAYLFTNPLERALVDFYDRVSPPVADFTAKHPAPKPVVRAGLVPTRRGEDKPRHYKL